MEPTNRCNLMADLSPVGYEFRRSGVNDTEPSALAFLARITESVTLDLRNALATVKENAEFLEDIISADGAFVSSEKERFSQSLSVIKDQVARGAHLATRLNAFSQSPDKPRFEMDLNELLQMLVRICEPTASLKGITIRIIPGSDPLIVLGNPLEIEMALYDCVDFLVNAQGVRGIIEIRATRKGTDEIVVAFLTPESSGVSQAESPFRGGPARWNLLHERLKRVGGSLIIGRYHLRLSLVFRNDLI